MENSKKEYMFFVVLMILISLLTLVDVIKDYSDGTDLSHIWTELSVILFTVTLSGYFVWKIFKQNTVLSGSLLKTRQDLTFWKKRSASFIKGLSESIDQQLELWGLSKSEKEIALMLVKGLSAKEIAQARGSAEKTVRTQITSIYKKSNLSNRSELAAFFLEDLLLPQEASSTKTVI